MGRVLAFAIKGIVAGGLVLSSVAANAQQCAPGTPGCVASTEDDDDDDGGLWWLWGLAGAGAILAVVLLAGNGGDDDPASP